jgi:hypothetical protein
MNPSGEPLSRTLKDSSACSICSSMDALLPSPLSHWLHIVSPGSELFISNYCQNTAPTYSLSTVHSNLCGSV